MRHSFTPVAHHRPSSDPPRTPAPVTLIGCGTRVRCRVRKRVRQYEGVPVALSLRYTITASSLAAHRSTPCTATPRLDVQPSYHSTGYLVHGGRAPRRENWSTRSQNRYSQFRSYSWAGTSQLHVRTAGGDNGSRTGDAAGGGGGACVGPSAGGCVRRTGTHRPRPGPQRCSTPHQPTSQGMRPPVSNPQVPSSVQPLQARALRVCSLGFGLSRWSGVGWAAAAVAVIDDRWVQPAHRWRQGYALTSSLHRHGSPR